MNDRDYILNNYVGQSEAAKILNISNARISTLCNQSRFENAVKIGGSWLIPKVSLQNFTRKKPGRKNPDIVLLETAIKESKKWQNATNA